MAALNTSTLSTPTIIPMDDAKSGTTMKHNASANRVEPPTLKRVRSVSWNPNDDEELAVELVYGKSQSYITDAEMTKYWMNHEKHGPELRAKYWVGTPDSTIFAHGTSIEGDDWKDVKMMQVTRAYNRLHLHAMLAEKIFKSAVFLDNSMRFGKDIEMDIGSFVIAIFVRKHLLLKAERVALVANHLLHDSVFRIQILSPGEKLENEMFHFIPDSEKLSGNRHYYNQTVPRVVIRALDEAEMESLAKAANDCSGDIFDLDNITSMLCNLFLEDSSSTGSALEPNG